MPGASQEEETLEKPRNWEPKGKGVPILEVKEKKVDPKLRSHNSGK